MPRSAAARADRDHPSRGAWPIDRIEEAIAALMPGEVTRAVLDHDR